MDERRWKTIRYPECTSSDMKSEFFRIFKERISFLSRKYKIDLLTPYPIIMPLLARLSMLSMVVGLLVGFAYRELTRNFDGETILGAVHGHVFTLGMMWYLLVLLLDDRFGLSRQKYWKSFLWVYTL